MPRVTININAFGNAQDELLTLDVPLSLTIKDLKAFVEHEAAAQPPAAALHFFLNGRPLTDDVQTLEAAGIKDGEMLAALVRGRDTGPAEREEDREAETARQNTLNDPKSAAALRETVPALAAALDDAARWRDEYKRLKRKEQQAKRERENLMALLNEDPFNVEAQKKIEEIIRQEAVITNLQEAIEETPEVFGRVHMLYTEIDNTSFFRVHERVAMIASRRSSDYRRPALVHGT
ncbi:hypothetical protein M011DRAFT_337860 [Sporormia fimetaria CBS 119925]|uniref:Ubiquitin-like domain-containing protein n=1 Tax=Sporormia fimetaria CBS 119925 TaxID=1340428 RepID=A0A6A6VDU1_9PLEO|nr:hypothetical protein M011DRAFT_337860 [Sporormia fimetaria CBS 119925]